MSVATRTRRSTSTHYPVKVQEFARRLYESGWRICEVQEALAKRGYYPSQSTVSHWCKPDLRDLHNFKRREARYPHLKPRQPETIWWAKLRRMRELRSAGLSFADVAKVANLDFGIDLTRHQCEAILKGRYTANGVRKALAPKDDRP